MRLYEREYKGVVKVLFKNGSQTIFFIDKKKFNPPEDTEYEFLALTEDDKFKIDLFYPEL